MHYIVYKITNKVNGKIYIGKHQTERVNDEYFGSGKRLKYAISKYGRANFVKEILHVFDTEDEMNVKEAELVSEEFCKRDDTYNLCSGGKGGWGFINQNRLWSTEKHKKASSLNFAKAKEKQILLMRTDPQYRKELFSKTMKNLRPLDFSGQTHTDETKLKISKKLKIAQLGEKNSQFGSRWITNGLENRKIKVDIVPEGWYYGRV